MSCSVLFSEQPCLNWLQMSPVLYVVAIGISDESIWAQPQDHCSCCIWSNECVWSTLGQVKCDCVWPLLRCSLPRSWKRCDMTQQLPLFMHSWWWATIWQKLHKQKKKLYTINTKSLQVAMILTSKGLLHHSIYNKLKLETYIWYDLHKFIYSTLTSF